MKTCIIILGLLSHPAFAKPVTPIECKKDLYSQECTNALYLTDEEKEQLKNEEAPQPKKSIAQELLEAEQFRNLLLLQQVNK